MALTGDGDSDAGGDTQGGYLCAVPARAAPGRLVARAWPATSLLCAPSCDQVQSGAAYFLSNTWAAALARPGGAQAARASTSAKLLGSRRVLIRVVSACIFMCILQYISDRLVTQVGDFRRLFWLVVFLACIYRIYYSRSTGNTYYVVVSTIVLRWYRLGTYRYRLQLNERWYGCNRWY